MGKLALQVELQEIEKFRPSHIRSMPDESKIGGSHGPAGNGFKTSHLCNIAVGIALSRRRLIPWPLAFVVHNLRRVAWSRFVLPVLKVCEIAWQRIRCQICWMGLRNPENFCEHQNSRSRHDSKADQCAKAANTPASHYPWEHLISPVMSLPEFNLLDFSWCLLWFFDVWDVLSPLPPESDWKLPLGRAMARLLSGDCMEIVRY